MGSVPSNSQSQLHVVPELSKDDGEFTYIDQTATKVTRNTRLNNPDVTLSEDQNDVIHAVAMKQMATSRFATDGDKAQRVPSMFMPSGTASSSMCAPASAATAMSDEECDEEDDDDEMPDMSLDPKPFQGLFSRMAKPEKKRPAAAAAAAPSSAATAKRLRTGAGNAPPAADKPTNKGKGQRNKGRTPDEAPGDSFGLQKLDLNTEQGKEDSALIENYLKQFRGLKHLNAPKWDDQCFVPWIKTRGTKLQELKSAIKMKQKSLKRRKEDHQMSTNRWRRLLRRSVIAWHSSSDWEAQLVQRVANSMTSYSSALKMMQTMNQRLKSGSVAFAVLR